MILRLKCVVLLAIVLGSFSCVSIDGWNSGNVAATDGSLVRFDGLYRYHTEGKEANDYLRFYPDGKLAHVFSTGQPRDVGEWLRYGRHGTSPEGKGRYSIKGSQLTIIRNYPDPNKMDRAGLRASSATIHHPEFYSEGQSEGRILPDGSIRIGEETYCFHKINFANP